jgi:hypothetical protein
LGLVDGVDGVAEGLVFFGVFVAEDDVTLDGESELEGVLGGDGLAFGGARAGGSGGVGYVGGVAEAVVVAAVGAVFAVGVGLVGMGIDRHERDLAPPKLRSCECSGANGKA